MSEKKVSSIFQQLNVDISGFSTIQIVLYDKNTAWKKIS
jgi:hypothetical protein